MKFLHIVFNIDKDGKDEIKIELCDSDLKIANSINFIQLGPNSYFLKHTFRSFYFTYCIVHNYG